MNVERRVQIRGKPRQCPNMVGIVMSQQHAIDISEIDSGRIEFFTDRFFISRPTSIHEGTVTVIDYVDIRLIERSTIDMPETIHELSHHYEPVRRNCLNTPYNIIK